jgi:hypothetical protein
MNEEDSQNLKDIKEVLVENNDVLKATAHNTLWTYYVLIVIAVMLSWILFAVVFKIAPWWE